MGDESFNIYDENITFSREEEDDIYQVKNETTNDDVYGAPEEPQDEERKTKRQKIDNNVPTERPEFVPDSESTALHSEIKGMGHKVVLDLSGMTWWTTDQDLADFLSQFGRVKKYKFIEDKTNGKSQGRAYAEMDNEQDTLRAFEGVKVTPLHGRLIEVTLAPKDIFKQLNTHNKGRKERREAGIGPMSGGSGPKMGGPGRGRAQGGRGRGRGDPPMSQGPPMMGYYPPKFPGGYPFPMPMAHVNPAFFNVPPGGRPYPYDRYDDERERDNRDTRDSRDTRDTRDSRDTREDRDRERDNRDSHRDRDRDRDRDRRSRERDRSSRKRSRESSRERDKYKSSRH